MDKRSASPPSEESEELEIVPVRRVSRGSSLSASPKGLFSKPLAPPTETHFEPDQIELQIIAYPDADSEIRAGEDVDLQDNEGSSRPKPQGAEPSTNPSSSGPCGFLTDAFMKFYRTLLCPEYFLLFNVICIIQAVAALYYYISFFNKGYFARNSAGMTIVWPSTIGSISATIVGSALGPLPDGLITRYFAIAVIVWYFVIALFVFIAAVCLGLLGEHRAVIWSVLCVLSALSSGAFLLWLGLNFKEVKAKYANKYKAVDSKTVDDEEMPAFTGEEEVSRSSKPGTEGSIIRSPATTAAKEEEQEEKTPSTVAIVVQRAVQTLLWLVLFVFYMIPIGFGIDQAMTAREHFKYQKTGQLYSIAAEVNKTKIMIDMHMYCTGSTNSSKPTILIEADKGTSGFAYYNLQSLLSDDTYNWRVCTYDRAGYGWSAVSPLGTTLPRNTLSRLEDLLSQSGELEIAVDGQFLLVGHGAGGELVQIFAQAHPDRTAGLALLDTYPSDFRLHGLSGKQIKIDSKKICGNYQILRAMDSAAYARPVTDTYMDQADKDHTQFTPSSQLPRYKSTFTNGKYWASLYNDYCMRPAGFTLYTDTLSKLPNTVSSERDSSLTKAIRWPQLEADVPVLIVAAGKSTDNGKESNVYYQQALAYQSTLSPTNTSQLVICNGCHKTFPIDSHSSWLAQLIHEHFSAFY